MSKLYGPDEGYEVVNSRSSLKKGVKKVENKKETTQHVSMYSTVRGKISELICDQELVLHGPPFNPVVDLASLSHEQFVNRASRVITKLNPEGHPPPGVSSPTMMNLIDQETKIALHMHRFFVTARRHHLRRQYRVTEDQC